jgi:hypothetical protein
MRGAAGRLAIAVMFAAMCLGADGSSPSRDRTMWLSLDATIDGETARVGDVLSAHVVGVPEARVTGLLTEVGGHPVVAGVRLDTMIISGVPHPIHATVVRLSDRPVTSDSRFAIDPPVEAGTRIGIVLRR